MSIVWANYMLVSILELSLRKDKDKDDTKKSSKEKKKDPKEDEDWILNILASLVRQPWF